MADPAKQQRPRSRRAGAARGPRAEPHEGARQETHEQARCPVTFCPICIAVTGTQPVRAEVLGHLLAAGQELLMAVQAAVAPAEGDDDPPSRFEKIDLA